MNRLRGTSERRVRAVGGPRRCVPGVQALESRQLLASFAFDPDGPGPLSPTNIDPSGLIGGFDFSVGNALAQGAVTAINQKLADPAGPNPQFQILYQATLAGFINPGGTTVGAPGLNGMPASAAPFQITVLASITEELLSYDPMMGTAIFRVAPGQDAASFYRIYFHTGATDAQALTANNLTGTGFADGTLVLSGVPVGGSGSEGLFNLNMVPGTTPPTPVVGPFDQFGADNAAGRLTIVGNGAAAIPVRVQQVNPSWFLTPITNLSFNTTANTPFLTTNPSAAFSAAVGGSYTTVTPDLGPINGTSGADFQTSADANASTRQSSLRLVKYVNGVDANTPPGPNIPVGSPVNYTYSVTNTGELPLTGLTITDDNGTPGAPGDDFAPAPVLVGGFNSGDLDQDGRLDPGETWNFAGPSKVATAGVTTNLATATATDAFGSAISDSDPASYNGVAVVSPGIQVVKFVNGQDANTPPGPNIPVGSPVNYTYAVTNTGNVPLTGITLVDDNGTPGNPADDFAPTPILAGGFNTGDVNQDGTLDPGETWNYAGPSKLATLGVTTNIVTVSGTDAAGTTVSDTDPASYSGVAVVSPGIRVVKLVNGQDANTPPGPNIPVGAPVNYTYQVTNTGNQPLTGITLVDDNGTPGNPADDFAPAPILVNGFNSGDLNQDGTLDPGETWNYAGPSKLATLGVTTNIVTASGTDALGTTVSDSDPASYNGVAVVSPGIQVVKFVNGQDANTPPGPSIPVGAAVNYTYAVTNTGNVPLTGITLVDDNGTPGNPADDFAPTPILAGGFNTGDLNQDGTLDPGETWNYAGPSKLATLGVTTNIVTASGTDPEGTTVSDSDPASYNGVAVANPGIRIVKFVNGQDANTPPGPNIPVGAPVNYTYQVTNTGNVSLTNITIVDDNGTPANPADDFAPAPVLVNGFNSGDLDQDGTLDPGETWNYAGPSKTATLGVTTNLATVTATAPGGTVVNSSDPASYNGVSPALRIALAKQASGLLLTTVDSLVRMGYHDQHTRVVLGFTAPLNAARAQDLGNYTLLLAGRDGRFGTADDRTARLLSAVYDPTLRTVTLKTADKLAIDGRYRLIVNCDPPTGLIDAAGVPVDGDDNGQPGGAFVRDFGRDAFRLNLNRVVQTVDTTGAVGPLVNLGDPVTFSYQVTNPGVAPLAITGFVDNAGTPNDPADDFTPTYVSGDTNGNGLVDPTETWRYTATRPAGAGQYTNTATVTAGSPDVPPGTTVSASATANAFGVVPTVNSLERWNYHNQSTLVVLGYNGPLSVAAASNPALYEIVGPNQQRVAISRVSVDPVTRTVTLVPAARLNVHQVYRVTARSPFPGGPTFTGTLAGSGSLASPFPRPLPPIATVARTPRAARIR